MYPTELEIKNTTESNTSASYLDLLLSICRDGQLRNSIYDKRDDFDFHITNFLSWVATSLLRPPMTFSSFNSSNTPGHFLLLWMFYFEGMCDFPISFSSRDMSKNFRNVSMKFLWSVQGSYQTIWSPPLSNVTWHSGRWPYTVTPSIDEISHQFLTTLRWTLLPNMNLYLIERGFHRTFTTGAACHRGCLLIRTPGSVPLWDLHMF